MEYFSIKSQTIWAMKANEVLKLLKVTRQTLGNYVKRGLIQVTQLKTGHYEYDSESVYSFLNPQWKQAVNLGKLSNQKFVQIPFLRFIEFICYKASLVGIKVTIQEESYTSKCSALDLEYIGKHEDHAYAGKRIKRGLFESSLGFLINTDVNGALNILRKVIGDSFLEMFVQKLKQVARIEPSSGYLCYPLKVSL